jgi:hypothetical protein
MTALPTTDGFVITPSDTVDIVNDVNNVEGAEYVFLHNPTTGGTVRILPAGQKGAQGFTLTGTSGTANINVNGTNYLATFGTDLSTTATAFVTTHAAAILANHGVVVTKVSTSTLRFKTASSLTITNATGNLSGTALTPVPITVYINQGDVCPIAVRRVYNTTPTPPTGLIGLFGGPEAC